MAVEPAGVERGGHAGREQELADRSVALAGWIVASHSATSAGSAGRASASWNGLPSPSRTTPSPRTERSIIRVRSSNASVAARHLGAVDSGELERHDLAEPSSVVALEHDVAADLELEPVQRGLQLEAPSVDRRREREDRLLDLPPQLPELGRLLIERGAHKVESTVAERMVRLNARPGRRSLRADDLQPLRAQRPPAARRVARPLAELRARTSARHDPRDLATGVRPRDHALRPREQLRAAVRLRRGELRPPAPRRLRAVPRRARRLDEGGLRHVARPVRRVGLAQVPAREPRPEPRAARPRVRRHLLLAPVRPGHAARGDDGRARQRGAARARRSTSGSRRTRRRRRPRRPRSCATSARRC